MSGSQLRRTCNGRTSPGHHSLSAVRFERSVERESLGFPLASIPEGRLFGGSSYSIRWRVRVALSPTGSARKGEELRVRL